MLDAVLEYVSPRLEVDAKLKRFHGISFWVRGAKIVHFHSAEKLLQKLLETPRDEERGLQHKQVVMLLRYKDHDVELRGYRNVFHHALDELITGGVARLKKMDVFLMSSALFIGFLAFFVQKLMQIGVNRHVNITWHWTLMIAFIFTAASGYFRLNTKRHNYHRSLAESKHAKLIASDEALLTYLFNEAEDEIVKDALLTLVGILKRTGKQQEQLTVFGIEKNASDWLRDELGLTVYFKTSLAALEILESTRLIVRSKHYFDLSHNCDIDLSVAGGVFPIVVHEFVNSPIDV